MPMLRRTADGYRIHRLCVCPSIFCSLLTVANVNVYVSVHTDICLRFNDFRGYRNRLNFSVPPVLDTNCGNFFWL